jgi:MATE family multidrug resistance protein
MSKGNAHSANALDGAEFGLDELRLLSAIANRDAQKGTSRKGVIKQASSPLVEGEQMNGKTSEGPSRHEPLRINRDAPLFSKIALIARLSGPVMASCCLQMASGIILMYYAGRLSAKTKDVAIFAGVSMANMFANVSWFSLVVGMSSAVETLGSQNNGAKNYREVGIILQRSIVVLSMLLLPVSLLWLFVGDIFAALGTDPDICLVMHRFLLVRLFSMPVDVISRSYAKYLICLGLTKPDMCSQITAVTCTAVFGGLAVHYFDLDYDGLAASSVLAVYVSFLTLLGTSMWDPAVRRTIQPPSREAFTKLSEFVKLGLPGIAMLCAEWWAFEFLTIFASRISAEAVAYQTVMQQMSSFAYMAPLGLSAAASTVVGNSIGAGEIALAKELSRILVLCFFVLESFVSPTILFYGSDYVSLFSEDPTVLSMSRRSIPIIAAFTVADGLSAVLSGITRGAGRQHLGATGNVMAYYLCGLPLAYYFAFHTSLGVVGLQAGIAFAPGITDMYMSYYIFCRPDYMFVKEAYTAVRSDSADEDALNTNNVDIIAEYELPPAFNDAND